MPRGADGPASDGTDGACGVVVGGEVVDGGGVAAGSAAGVVFEADGAEAGGQCVPDQQAAGEGFDFSTWFVAALQQRRLAAVTDAPVA